MIRLGSRSDGRPLCGRRRRGLPRSGAALLLAGLTSACFSDRPGPAAPIDEDAECTIPASALGVDRALVLVHEFRFVPDTVRVSAGTTVTWVSCEPPAREAHTVTAADGSWGSGTLPAGARFARRFDQAGSADYFCEPHPHMRGVVIVE